MKLVFVSSTFKDMQFERDALHTLTAPQINESLLKYGESIYFGDLRWGVNTTALDSEEGSKRVLEVCLDEIDDCKPYMIVLIGERYGWIPDGELIRRAAEQRGITVPDGISVTQLEIEYGALSNAAGDGRVLFYFRDLDKSGMSPAELCDYNSETELHSERVEALKNKIRELYPESVRTYTAKWDPVSHTVGGFDGFLDTVRDDLSRLISADIDADMSLPWQKRAMLCAHRYFLDNAKHYADIEREPSELFTGPFAKNDCRMLFIKGDVGSGKTAYISHLYDETVKRDGVDSVIPFVLGLDQYSTTVMDYFKILLYVIEERAGFDHYETEYGIDGIDTEVIKRIFSYEGLCGSVIHSFIDNCSYELQNALSVHLLDSHIKNADFEYFNSNECPHEFFDFKLAYAAGEADVMLAPWFDFSRTVLLGKIKGEEVTPLVMALLKRKHKELAEPVIRAIAGKGEASRLTYLGLVTERLLMLDSRDFAEIRRMGDGMENINKYQLSLIERLPDTATEMTAELVSSVAERVNPDLVMRTLALLVYSGVTLYESEIREIFDAAGWEFSSLDFALATRSLTSVIKYNPREKTYSVKNQQVIAALATLLEEREYTYVSHTLLNVLGRGSVMSRLGEARFNAASYAGSEELVSAMTESYHYWNVLPKKLEQLLRQHGAEYIADILCELVRRDTAHDWGYLIERIPTVCTTGDNYRVYYSLLTEIIDRITPTKETCDNLALNSFFTVVWCKFIHFKMRVNSSDAAPFYYAYHDDGIDKYPMNDRARVNYEITRLRFVGKECYQTMSQRDIDFDLIATDALITEESFPRADEEYVFRANLNAAFIYYVEHSFDLNYYDPEFISEHRRSVLNLYLTLNENLKDDISAITSDDVATMIDTALGDKKDYAEIDYRRLCNTLDFMYTGQTYVDSRLNKYLPHIMEAARFSLDGDDEWDDAPADPINLYKRIVAYSRAIAGTSVTLDECLNAVINIGYAVDVLSASDEIEWDDYSDMLLDLYRFIRICLNMANGDVRVFYRLFMPISYYFSALRVNGIEDPINELCDYLSGYEAEDENAPLLPELFVGALVYEYREQGNEELRLRLRAIRENIEEDPDYAPYVAAYTPELMYIDVSLRSEEEIEADNADINFSINLDTDSDEWDTDSDDTDGDSFDFGAISPEAIRAMLEAQGINTDELPDDFILSMLDNLLADDGDGDFDLDDDVFDDCENIIDVDMIDFDEDED